MTETKFRSYSLTKTTDKLKELINQHPDYEICVLAGEEANGGDFCWMFCSEIWFEVGELLDADYYDYNECVITDRDRLEEVIEDNLYDEYSEKSDEEYEAAIKAEIKRLEPYWKKVIFIYATN